MSRTRSGLAALACSVALMCGMACVQLLDARAQWPTLTVSDRESKKTYSQQDLLTHRALRDVTVADPVYGRSMTYRAIPIADLLKDMKIGADDYIQARATDNFSISIPGRLLGSANTAHVEAFLAVEDPAAPWPVLAKSHEKLSAGPFYIVWRLGPGGHVSREYWTFQLAALAVTDSPLKRWPGLAVAADVPAADPIRTGLHRYVELCMSCHRFNGDGEGEQGPDLGRPMNAVDYFQIPALKKLIRNPSSVRKWPEQKMPRFDESTLSDSDLDAMIAWLAYKARQPR
jgi:mono/diheme cytochrome c family protein